MESLKEEYSILTPMSDICQTLNSEVKSVTHYSPFKGHTKTWLQAYHSMFIWSAIVTS